MKRIQIGAWYILGDRNGKCEYQLPTEIHAATVQTSLLLKRNINVCHIIAVKSNCKGDRPVSGNPIMFLVLLNIFRNHIGRSRQ